MCDKVWLGEPVYVSAHRVRDCSELEDVSDQGRGFMHECYMVKNSSGALGIMEAEKVQKLTGCLHCKNLHRSARRLLWKAME